MTHLLTATKAMADYFEAILKTGKPDGMPLTGRAKMAGNCCWANSPVC